MLIHIDTHVCAHTHIYTHILRAQEQKVVPSPDVTFDTIYEGDSLLICCDGIVEQMTGQAAGNFVYQHLQQGV